MTARSACVAAIALLVSFVAAAGAPRADQADEAQWAELKEMVFGDRRILDGDGIIALEAPDRAYDAAIVPVTIRALIPQAEDRHVRTITLLIDKNPVPVAAVFHMTPDTGVATISTRIRINEYTNVRAVAETSDGMLFQAVRFVKAAGGCSAPAMKDQEAALARLGRMKLRYDGDSPAGQPAEAQFMISHPNYSGLQMNQLTRHYIPAHYVENIRISYGDRTLMTVEGDISLSENPTIGFHYVPHGPGEIAVEAVDTEGNVFSRSWPVAPRTGS